ncbi:MAG: S9 family peptidase [FCB group bacterium]|nr:S9 family peptidase [FCB group bacterium]
MKRSIFLLAVTILLSIVVGCNIEKEVDFAAGETSTDLSAWFGKDTYIPDIETFMKIGWTSGPGISDDGQQVFFQTGFSGVSQLYRLTKEGWPSQITFFPDGIDWYVLSHSSDMAIVGASVGGSEQSQLNLVDTRSGRTRQLTDTPKIQYGSVIWDLEDKTIFFRSNMDNLRDFKLYRMDVASGEYEKLVDAEGYHGWGDLSLDGKKLLYYRFDSNVNDELFLFELESGESTHLTPHEGDILYDNFFFSADGNAIYLTCDDNDMGFNLRAKMDLATKEITYLDADAQWNVEGVSYSPDRDIMAWILNEDGYGRMKLAEIESGLELPAPDFDGIMGSATLSKTSRMLFSFSSPQQTADIWSWNWQTKKAKKLTNSVYAGIDPTIFTAPKLIKYKSFDGMEIPAFIYLPADYDGSPIPFILDIHGGPEGQFRPYFNRHFQYLMLNGFGLLAPNVRGSDGYGKEYLALDNYRNRLKSVKDMKAGADWLIEQGYSQQGMIGVKGGSYGGYMTMAAVTEYPGFFSAACNNVGIVNFVSFLENTSAYRRHLRESEYGPLTDKPFLKSISPVHKANLITTPLMIVHGENDPRVPVDEARQIIRAIERRGGIVEPLIFPDEGHGIGKLANRLTFYRQMADFFKRHLQK